MRLLRQLRNLILFLLGCFRYGVPPWKWGKAWRGIQEDHQARVHKVVWELKKRGRVRQDKEGRLWSTKK